MSCENATSPINIMPTNITCNEKCKLNYRFKTTGISAINQGLYLSILPVDNNSSITFSSATDTMTSCSGGGGDNSYSIGEMRIYRKSLHTYNDTRADAELLLHLNSTTGPRNLVICIPIIQSDNAGLSTAGQQLTEIIEYITPFETGTDTGLIPGSEKFDLNKFIPKKAGYYSYTAKMPFEPCSNSCTDLLVYDMSTTNASITLTSSTFNKLNEIIHLTQYTIQPRTDDSQYAHNKNGATYGGDSDEIYIDCQPTGSSGEILIGEGKDTLLNENPFNLLKGMNPQTLALIKRMTAVIGLIALIIGIIGIILGLIYKFTKKGYFTNTPSTGGGLSNLNSKR